MLTSLAVICNNILLLLCQHLQPSYVMTFEVIPLFLIHFGNQQILTSTQLSAKIIKKLINSSKAGITSTVFVNLNIL
jgi:hypothetical protein